jgi:GNAT superfamily N-acetyltransferase
VLLIRLARVDDRDAIWAILEPVLRAGETYTLPRDISREGALAYWHRDGHEVFVAEEAGSILGTYHLHANQPGGGDHVANCGYMTSQAAQGRGVARAMLEHSLARARARGFLAMQFNFVVSTNVRAVKTWSCFAFPAVFSLRAGPLRRSAVARHAPFCFSVPLFLCDPVHSQSRKDSADSHLWRGEPSKGVELW